MSLENALKNIFDICLLRGFCSFSGKAAIDAAGILHNKGVREAGTEAPLARFHGESTADPKPLLRYIIKTEERVWDSSMIIIRLAKKALAEIEAAEASPAEAAP